MSTMRWIEPIVERYERPLLHYALSLCGDGEAARDLVQETFLRLARHGELKEEHWAPWLFTVCRNRAFDLKRKEGRIIAMPTTLDAVAAGEPGPSKMLQKKEAASRLAMLLERLPENQREVLRLRFQCDLSYREIAEVTQLGVSHVGVLIHAGVNKLRELWPDHSEVKL